MTESTRYVVIAEYKNDAPLVHETYIHRASYEEACHRMEVLRQRNNVIRVSIAKLVFENGHQLLLEHKPQ